MKSKKVCKFKKIDHAEFSFVGLRKSAQINFNSYARDERKDSLKKQSAKEVAIAKRRRARKIFEQKEFDALLEEHYKEERQISL